MSVINNILKDLNQRRVNGNAENCAPIEGFSASVQTTTMQTMTGRYLPLVGLVGAVVIVLASISLFIMYNLVPEAVGGEQLTYQVADGSTSAPSTTVSSLHKIRRDSETTESAVDQSQKHQSARVQSNKPAQVSSISAYKIADMAYLRLSLDAPRVYHLRWVAEDRLIELGLKNAELKRHGFSTNLSSGLIKSVSTEKVGDQLIIRLLMDEQLAIAGSAYKTNKSGGHELEIKLIVPPPPGMTYGATAKVDKNRPPLPRQALAAKEPTRLQDLKIERSLIAKTKRPLTNAQRAELSYQTAVQRITHGDQKIPEAELSQAIELNPNHHRARETLAAVFVNTNRPAMAIEILERGMALAPHYAGFRKIYARILGDKGKYSLAIKAMEHAEVELTQHPDYYALLAAFYQRNRQHNQAVQLYKQLVRHDPQLGTWWLGLGISLEAMQNPGAALDAYQRANRSGSLKTRVAQYVKKKIRALNRTQGRS